MNTPIQKKYLKEARQEVIDLHVQIEDLFHNKNDTPNRLPFLSYFHPGFTMISPDGVLRDLSALRDWFETAAGSRPQVKISIKHFKENFVCVENVIVTYEEHQQVTEATSLHRLSTAVFLPTNNPKQPVLWRHLHETWIKK